MRSVLVLPIYPLADSVLLPGERLKLQSPPDKLRAVIERAQDFGGVLITSLLDGDTVHEIGVTALVTSLQGDSIELRGITRCQLLSIEEGDVALVKAHRYPDRKTKGERGLATARLLLARHRPFIKTSREQSEPLPKANDLSSVTWRVIADLGFAPEQQQGFLVVPDALTRGKLLLLAVRELEKRQRFVRPFAHLRGGAMWN